MAEDVPVRDIEPPHGWLPVPWRELWAARELLYFLTWRDVKVRYTQAALGVAWAVIQPLLMMAIFSVFLGRVVKVPSADVPYPAFVFSGLVLWMFFANGLAYATESLVTNSGLISKVYFPRLLLPTSAVLAWVPDLLLSTVLVVLIGFAVGAAPGAAIVLAPLFALLAFGAAAGAAYWLSALNVAYRDIRYAVPFLIQVGLFATPVVYPASLVPERFRLLLGLNPMSGAVQGFRWALVGGAPPDWGVVSLSVAVALGLLISGLAWFRRVEHGFADVV